MKTYTDSEILEAMKKAAGHEQHTLREWLPLLMPLLPGISKNALSERVLSMSGRRVINATPKQYSVPVETVEVEP